MGTVECLEGERERERDAIKVIHMILMVKLVTLSTKITLYVSNSKGYTVSIEVRWEVDVCPASQAYCEMEAGVI